MDNILEIKDVSKKFDKFSIKDININLPKGSIMGFIGANGAGKTVTMKLILNSMKRDSGTIKIFGKEMKEDEKSIKENIGVAMDNCYFPQIVNAVNVDYIMNNIYSNWESKTFFDYIEKFNIDKKKKVKDYSKGMKMKLSIAVALAHRAKLLLLDEATSGLDTLARDEMLDVLREFIQDEENSVLISSHILSDLEKVCDYITFINDGEIIFSDEKDNIIEKYRVLRLSEDDYERIDKSLTIGVRKSKFCIEALIEKDNINMIKEFIDNKETIAIDNVNLEEIMLFSARGGK